MSSEEDPTTSGPTAVEPVVETEAEIALPAADDVEMMDASGNNDAPASEAQEESSAGQSTVGWDTSLMGESAPEAKTDANDYSRFNAIEDSDSDDGEAKPATSSPARALCGNCRAPNARMKCSICKKMVYCNRQCQKSDWTFHKRTCKKPKPPAKAKKPGSGSSSASTPAPAPAPAAPSLPKSDDVEVVDDEEDLKDLKGYRYFAKSIGEEEKALIGNITPQRISNPGDAAANVVADVPTASPDPAAVESTGAVDSASPGRSATFQRQSSSSAWNHAATWEERNCTDWAKEKLKEVVENARLEFEGGAYLRLTKVKKCDGDAHIAVVRGTNRYIFDFPNFQVKWKAAESADGRELSGEYEIPDLANDSDFEIRVKWAGSESAALRTLLGTPGTGGQAFLMERIQAFIEEFQARV